MIRSIVVEFRNTIMPGITGKIPRLRKRKPGKHRAPCKVLIQCGYEWVSKKADHRHRCGDAPHGWGDHHCYGDKKNPCNEKREHDPGS